MENLSACTEKYGILKEKLLGLGRVLVAFSGGVDSTFLLKSCMDILGPENVLGVTAQSEAFPTREFEEAKKLALNLNIPWKTVKSSELDIAGFSENSPQRCYYCKKELFSVLKRIAQEEGYDTVLDGATASDVSDYRPGSKSAKELGVKSPLLDAGFEKEEIRILSKKMGLPTWEKGSFACLASRFPYGENISAEKLKMVEKAENILFELGFKQFRVRHHNEKIARIELMPEDFERVMDKECREKVISDMKDVGYLYISLDMEGYSSGSMNKGLNLPLS